MSGIKVQNSGFSGTFNSGHPLFVSLSTPRDTLTARARIHGAKRFAAGMEKNAIVGAFSAKPSTPATRVKK